MNKIIPLTKTLAIFISIFAAEEKMATDSRIDTEHLLQAAALKSMAPYRVM
ncbi:hypothetical protein [Shewanella algidipiscicola]|uniref:hypothetical protein n=1 Tax=Shewanella algidipiscicola TaxID=614070 RepID=UPI0013C4B7C0|nr:hypothetical protein [Shewanella algidipiscicola]